MDVKKTLFAIGGAIGVIAALRLFRRSDDSTIIPVIIAVVVVLALLLWWIQRNSAGNQKVIAAERQADPQVLVWAGYHIPQGSKPKAVALGVLKNKAVPGPRLDREHLR